MYNIITIPGSKDKPFIQIDQNENKYSIRGNCYPDDPKSVFYVLNEGLNKSIENDGFIYLSLELIYMNTGSKLIINDIIEKISVKSSGYKITWFYSDEDILDEIEYMEYCTGAIIKKKFKEIEL